MESTRPLRSASPVICGKFSSGGMVVVVEVVVVEAVVLVVVEIVVVEVVVL